MYQPGLTTTIIEVVVFREIATGQCKVAVIAWLQYSTSDGH